MKEISKTSQFFDANIHYKQETSSFSRKKTNFKPTPSEEDIKCT